VGSRPVRRAPRPTCRCRPEITAASAMCRLLRHGRAARLLTLAAAWTIWSGKTRTWMRTRGINYLALSHPRAAIPCRLALPRPARRAAVRRGEASDATHRHHHLVHPRRCATQGPRQGRALKLHQHRRHGGNGGQERVVETQRAGPSTAGGARRARRRPRPEPCGVRQATPKAERGRAVALLGSCSGAAERRRRSGEIGSSLVLP
jgi:hypothetical protein